jgi:hypothetical protein
MSIYAMALVAGLTLGDVPAPVSGEVVEGLDLRGEWEGVWHWPCGTNDPVTLSRGTMTFEETGPMRVSAIVDEGGGLCRLAAHDWKMPGIYRQQPDRVMICFRESKDQRPTAFQRTSEQHLLILHRVKPDK